MLLELIVAINLGALPEPPLSIFNPLAEPVAVLIKDGCGIRIIQSTPHYFTPIWPNSNILDRLMRQCIEPQEFEPEAKPDYSEPVIPDLGENNDA